MPDDNKDKNNPKVSTTQPKPNKGANGPANGEQPKGTTDPNAGHGATTDVNRNPAAPRTTLVEVHLNDDVRNDPNARVGSPVGPAVGRNKYGGTPGDPWGTRARLDAQRQAQHEKNMQAQAAQRQAWRDSSARVTRDFAAKRQATQDAINSGDFTNLKTISADNWKKLGERNGEIRSSYVKDENGNLVQDGVDENGKPKFKMTYQEGQGSMFDATKGAKDVAALEKWWAEEGVATSRGNIPKGVFDENGKLKTEGLTADQFGALQKIMSNSQERLAPLRERAQMNDHQNYLNASEYLSGKGVKVWDTATGKRILSRDQVMQMAREMKLGDAKAALEGMAPAWNKANSLQTDSNGNVFTDPKDQEFYQKRAFDEAKAKEAGLVNQLRRLGFRADQIADKDGNIDYGLIASALGGTGTPKEAPKEAPKAAPKAVAKTPAPTKGGEMDALAAGFRSGKGAEGSFSEANRAKSVDPLAAAGIRRGRIETKPEAAPSEETPVVATPRSEPAITDEGRQVFRDVYGIPEAQKPFNPSDVLGIKTLPDSTPQLRAGSSSPANPDTIRATGGVTDPMVGEFRRRGLNPLQTATMVAGAVPAGVTQVAGGTARILSGGDVGRGFSDILLGGATVAGGQVAGSATLKSGRGASLPQNRYSGGVMPGSSGVKATARRMEARAAEGEGVVNPRAVSRPLGRGEAAKVEAGYRRGAQMERNVKEAKAREAAEAPIRKFEKASRRRAAAEREDIRKSHEAGLRAQRAEQRKQVQDRIRRNESKAGYPKPAKKRRHN